MADLIERTPDLNSEKKLEQQAERTVGQELAEPASGDNLRLVKPMVEEIRHGGEPLAVEASVEPAPQQDLGAVLEDGQTVAAKAESAKEEIHKEKFSAFMEGKLGHW